MLLEAPELVDLLRLDKFLCNLSDKMAQIDVHLLVMVALFGLSAQF